MELADFNFHVYIVEKEPTLGGKAIMLGLAFPSDDGALCNTSSLLLFKSGGFRKCLYRSGLTLHPDLEVLTNSEIEKIDGDIGNFSVSVRCHPRYVLIDRCINCGKCAEVCPVESQSNSFQYKKRKAVYLPIEQSIPPAYVIDPDLCTRCMKCVEICPTKAIDLDQKEEIKNFNVDFIVIATGFDELKPSEYKEYNYGIYKNVITQLELGHMINEFGPTKGCVIRPSDGKSPRRIVMIQCVGSREEAGRLYCSKICCMYALKHALLLRERGIDVVIFYIDLRSPGRYEHYYEKARKAGVQFVRGKVSSVEEDPTTGELVVDFENTLTGEFMELKTDLVVLSSALIPSEGTKELEKILKVGQTEYGFISSQGPFDDVLTNINGVVVAGTASGPKDIPQTLVEANATSMELLSFINTQKTKKNRK